MFNIDRKYLYIILGILVVFSLANYINNPTELLTLLLTLPGVIIAITFHEFAHAWTAYKLGDNTPKNARKGKSKSTITYRSIWICNASICSHWLGKTSRNKPEKF